MRAPHAQAPSPKKATNISLAEPLLTEARALCINLSQAAEAGIIKAIAEKRAALWLQENHEALQSSNDYIDRNGLPLAEHRMF